MNRGICSKQMPLFILKNTGLTTSIAPAAGDDICPDKR